jgi:hypothetical protein
MNYIKKILNKKDASLEEFISCFERIKENGEVVVIKFDGDRSDNAYTIFISFPNNLKEMIRADESDFKKAIMKVLSKYTEYS